MYDTKIPHVSISINYLSYLHYFLPISINTKIVPHKLFAIITFIEIIQDHTLQINRYNVLFDVVIATYNVLSGSPY